MNSTLTQEEKDRVKEEFAKSIKNDVEVGIRTMAQDLYLTSFGHNPHLLASFKIDMQKMIVDALRIVAKEFEDACKQD